MILQSLVERYETLAKKGEIAKPGWGRYKVSYAVNLNFQGEVTGILSLETEEIRGKKTVSVPQLMLLPEGVKKSSGIRAQFLWANAAYCLGLPKGPKPVSALDEDDAMQKWEKDKVRAIKCFDAMKQLHLSILAHVHTPTATALKAFFELWNPEMAEENTILQPYLETNLPTANVIYAVNGSYVQDDEAIKNAWNSYCNHPDDDAVEGQCLVTGKIAPIARIHPNIKGVRGAQSAGASLISFNKEAFESYGHGQSYNAPVSTYAAFAYTTALNQLIADDKHCKVIGDTTVVYWAADGETAYQDVFSDTFFDDDGTIDDETLNDLFTHIQDGQPFDFNGVPVHPENPFYILGLAPNAARLSVRFFLRDSFGNFITHIRKHYERLEIVKPQNYRRHLSLWKLVTEASYKDKSHNDKKKKENKPKKIDKAMSLLAGDVMRSVLMDTQYPVTLYNNILLRVKADKDDRENHIYKISIEKAAIIKAFLLKNFPKGEKITVSLNEESTNTAYVLGRLFSVLEQIQEEAYKTENGKDKTLNSTIKDRYFNSAAATPGMVFPILLKMSNHHLRKLNDKMGLKISFEKSITNLEEKITMDSQPIPARMNLQAQGLFILGYYHQTQKRYTKKGEE